MDRSPAFIDRARQQALARGLGARVGFDLMPGMEAQDLHADAVICIGASQIWGPPVEDAQPLDYAAALRALRELVQPGGRLVYGEAIWMAPPHPAATAPLAGRDDEYITQDALRELIRTAGFDVIDDDETSLEEWDIFEAGFREPCIRWLEAHDADHPAAEQVRQQYEDQRSAYEDGYRGVLGWRTSFCLQG